MHLYHHCRSPPLLIPVTILSSGHTKPSVFFTGCHPGEGEGEELRDGEKHSNWITAPDVSDSYLNHTAIIRCTIYI